MLGTIDGIVDELYQFGLESGQVFDAVESIVATGSSVRKNFLFREALNRKFNRSTIVAQVDDGAGFGAALIGAVAIGALSLPQLKTVVASMIKS